jgi:eukaryotic-like serine/threonine-protein kinase
VRGQTTIAGKLSFRAPIANEEERATFQRRLGLTGALVFALAGGFYLVSIASVAILAPAILGHVATTPSSLIHAATTLGAAVMWLVLRRTKPSIQMLSALDLVGFAALCLGWALMITWGVDVGSRPESIALLASTYTLTLRAAFIPSTPARTALLSIVAFGPLLPITHAIYRGVVLQTQDPLPPVAYVAIWSGLGIVATTAISYIVHGLRQEVRKAMQLGQYLLEEKVGEGGMGVVYRASHALLRRPAAIKLLSHTAEQGISRFEREVQITAKLTHPNTVIVFDYGRTPDGTFYYAMEFLEGMSLEELVLEDGPQPARRVVHVLLQACGALEEAHANALVHRDIKPANIVLSERGLLPDFVKVLDFGLVKEIAAPDANLGQSSVNTIMGTPHYMAPEAIVEPASVDGRADLYALGATAYYLLTGERVFDGTNLVEVCSQHLHQPPVPPSKKRPDVPASLEKIVLACLAKKPEDRPKDAGALAKLLADARTELGEWTREEAHAWWQARPRKTSGAVAKASTKATSDASIYGHTIAVALDDRDRGAA